MPTDIVVELVKRLESKLEQSAEAEELHIWSSVLTYVTISYVTSLRGPDEFLLDLEGSNRHWYRSDEYVTIALLGRLKGEHHNLQHLIPCINVTASGIRVRTIIQNHMRIKELSSLERGLPISTREGKLLTTILVDDVVHELLSDIFLTNSSLFPASVDSSEKIIWE